MVDLVDLGAGRAQLLRPGRVLPAQDAAVLAGIAALRQAAEQDAAALVAAAHADAAAVREAARQEGLAAATEEIQDRLFEIAEASIDVIARSEQRIAELGLQIAERIIGSLDDHEAAIRVAKRGIRLAAHSSFVRLRVAPAEAEAVRERLDAVLGTSMPGSVVEVIADPRVRDQGCILETDAGLIDATIESQFAAIRRGLQRSFARPEAE